MSEVLLRAELGDSKVEYNKYVQDRKKAGITYMLSFGDWLAEQKN